MKYILITGGCGYIGSYLSMKLNELGYKTIIVDNLSTGFKDSLLCNEIFYEGDFSDPLLLESIFTQHKIECVFHLAASIKVEESVKNPLNYYENNVAKFISFLKILEKHHVKHLVLSSTAAIYGNINDRPVDEKHEKDPKTPYGRSKLMDEWILQDFSKVSNLKFIILRYFNVAGADPKMRLGQKSKEASHLIKVTSEVICKKRDKLIIYGKDYNTKDGTCIRDYIHIEDLVEAHLLCLKYLSQKNTSDIFNCGYSEGYSVQDIINCLRQKCGYEINIAYGQRRQGDLAYLVANTDKIKKVLKWQAKYNDIKSILMSAIEWESKNL